MTDEERATPRWLDVLWLLFLGGLALLPPVREYHKQVLLALIGAFQLLEGRFLRLAPRGGETAAVVVKLALATILMTHTSPDVGINSSYYPIFYLPVTTAAMYFGPFGTLLWTAIAGAAYCSYLVPALREFTLTEEGLAELSLRILFFFLVGMIVNRFVMATRLQTRRYQMVAENLGEANRNLKKAQDEARRAERLAALGQMSAGLAHEIRNPLGVIKGSAEILKDKLAASDAMAQELSGFIYTEVNRLSALVSRFLDFARPSRLQLHPHGAHELVEISLKHVIDQGAAARVSVRREYAANVPPVMVDAELCDQALTNLLLNACEAMGEKGGELAIRIYATPTPAGDGNDAEKGESVTIEIEDSGPGVPAELREQIFNPFVTTRKSGVGLGLAIVSKIIDAHGGALRLVSRPGAGARFQVTLPVSGAERPHSPDEEPASI